MSYYDCLEVSSGKVLILDATTFELVGKGDYCNAHRGDVGVVFTEGKSLDVVLTYLDELGETGTGNQKYIFAKFNNATGEFIETNTGSDILDDQLTRFVAVDEHKLTWGMVPESYQANPLYRSSIKKSVSEINGV